MRVVLLGPEASPITPIVGDFFVAATEDPVDLDFVSKYSPEMLVSFGYRHIVSQDVLDAVAHRSVNIHISLLPWNRGSDPNFWSWLMNTPKGVSIHWMSSGLDKGALIAQKAVDLDATLTLRSSYELLHSEAVDLFRITWEELKRGETVSLPQSPGGSYHSSKDKAPFFAQLSNGWDTPCSEVLKLGQDAGLWISDSETQSP
jgi:methionyl-tRNA formyltransferase